MVHVCGIIPPSLLKGIANSEVNEESIREEAQVSLEHHHQLSAHRYHRSCIHAEAHAAQNGSQPTNSFIPENILNQLQMTTAADGTAQQSTKLNPTLLALQVQQDQQVASVTEKVSARFVYNALNTMNDAGLPGTLTRIDGQSQVEDSAINQAFDNIGIVMQFYKDLFGWSGLDNQNGDVKGSVHVGRHMQNAYWNGKQMLFGDGGNYISNFTNCLDVIAHELTHAVTAHTTALVYEGQSGALNEHISDVFGIMVKHRAMNITVDKADWLLGEGCLLPGVKGVAVRSMKAPGTAYDDPRFGTDEQAGHMTEYIYEQVDVRHDFGGVHVNSGIPNKAFYLVATAFGGNSWEKAGQIWWKTIRSGQVLPRCTFLQFADITVDSAKQIGGDEAAKMVRQAWHDVGVYSDK